MNNNSRQEFSFESTYKLIEDSVSGAMESLADAVVGTAEALKDGTELSPVQLPRDLWAHGGAQTEWWYYTGHAETVTGRKFGFELVFFKRRTDLDKFSIFPLRLFGNPIYFAHFAITDKNSGKFRYGHRKSSNGILDYPASASDTHYYLRLGDWSVRESHGDHLLSASLNENSVFEASLKPEKPVVLNGAAGNGVSFKDDGEASRYFSFTRMRMEGDLTIDGQVEHFSGSAWMDREFGTWTATEKQRGWDWFSIQFEDVTELMVYQLRDSSDSPTEYSSGVFIDESGNSEFLSHTDFSIRPTGFWKSPDTGATYPSGWEISVPKKQLELTVDPLVENQELDTRGSTMIVYWEGACSVSARRRDIAVEGSAYVELVGYDRSHDDPNLAYFLMGNHFEKGN